MTRFLNARKNGSDMKPNDYIIVDTVLANLQEHNKQIAKRNTIRTIRAGIQKQADAELNQLKTK